MADRTIRYHKLDDLRGNPANPKDHSGELIAQSLDRFGLVEPQTLDERTGMLVAGHGRLDELRAKQDAGETPPEGVRLRGSKWYVPVVHGWASADDAEALAYLVTSNQSTIAGGWDVPKLADVLSQVQTTDLGLLATGYRTETLDELLASLRPAEPVEAAPAVERPDPPKRVARGEIWALGPHRLMCGDARAAGDVAQLLGDVRVHLAVTSPPYADRRKYDESTEFRPIPPEAYVDWFAPVAANVATHLAPDGSWFVNIRAGAEGLDTYLYVHDLVVAHVRRWGWHLAHEFCWARPGMPQRPARRFKPQWEPVYQFARGEWKIRPEAVMVPSDSVPRYQVGDNYVGERRQGDGSDAMSHRSTPGMAYPGDRLPTFSGSHEATGHEAAFPVGLPAWFMRAYTDEGDRVLDPFVGSDSTLLAAEQEGRLGFGMELSARYCDLVLDRWERHGGTPAERLDPPG